MLHSISYHHTCRWLSHAQVERGHGLGPHPYNISEEQRPQVHYGRSPRSPWGRVNCIVVGHITVTLTLKRISDLIRYCQCLILCGLNYSCEFEESDPN